MSGPDGYEARTAFYEEAAIERELAADEADCDIDWQDELDAGYVWDAT